MNIASSITARIFVAALLGLTVSAYSVQGSALAQREAATGCPGWGNPGGNSGLKFMGVMSPTDAVRQWSAQITPAWYAQYGFVEEEFLAARLAFATGIDQNGDGLLCVAQNWGANLNPNSHWALIWADTLDPPATERYFLSDNHVGTSKQ